MSVAVSDVSKLSDVNEVIKENLAMIETQYREKKREPTREPG